MALLQPEGYLVGVNLPWVNYGGDFGANAWRPEGGIAAPANTARARAVLDEVAASGADAVRWFLLCDGRAGLDADESGVPRGLDDRVFADLDCAVQLLERARLGGIFVLFDFLLLARRHCVNGVQTGGRSHVVKDAGTRRALLERVVEPILLRYGREPAILAWEVINEPEWAVSRVPWLRRRHVAPGTMRRFIGEIVERAHACAIQPVTVGSASVATLALVRDLSLDFYQVHWYDGWRTGFVPGVPVASLGLDRPLLLGEFATRRARPGTAEILRAARESGFAGAFPWSVLAGDRASDGDRVLRALQEMRPDAPCGTSDAACER